jgi:hypothetical protein
MPDATISLFAPPPAARNSTTVLSELAEVALTYADAMGGFLPYDGMDHAFVLEERLVRAGQAIIERTNELRGYPRNWPLSVQRHVDAILNLVRLQFDRWDWTRYAEPNRSTFVDIRLFNFAHQREKPFLRAVLTWRQFVGIPHHTAADNYADHALSLGLQPLEGLTCEEARELTFRLQREWHNGPALADSLPTPTDEEHIEASRAATAIKRFAESITPLPEPEPEPTQRAQSDGQSETRTDSPNPTNQRRKLSPCHIIAHSQYMAAIERCPALSTATDEEVYEWVKEHLDREETIRASKVWISYVRRARPVYQTSKHQSRRGRTGRSIVSPGEI